MKSLISTAVLVTLALAPSLALAASSVVGASSPGGGFFGVSGGNSSFGFSWGNGGGGGPFGACGTTICGVAQNFIFIINAVLVPLLFAVAFIMFLYGIAKAYIFSHGDPEEVKKGHKLVLWGVIGFVVMVSLWGLVNVVATTFGLGGYSAPPTPTSY